MLLNFPIIFPRMVGLITLICGISMIPSCILAIIQDPPEVLYGFLMTAISIIIGGALLYYNAKARTKNESFKVRDGYLAVSLCWFSVSFFGALPYYLSGTTDSLIDSIFNRLLPLPLPVLPSSASYPCQLPSPCGKPFPTGWEAWEFWYLLLPSCQPWV